MLQIHPPFSQKSFQREAKKNKNGDDIEEKNEKRQRERAASPLVTCKLHGLQQQEEKKL